LLGINTFVKKHDPTASLIGYPNTAILCSIFLASQRYMARIVGIYGLGPITISEVPKKISKAHSYEARERSGNPLLQRCLGKWR